MEKIMVKSTSIIEMLSFVVGCKVEEYTMDIIYNVKSLYKNTLKNENSSFISIARQQGSEIFLYFK